MIYIGIAIGGTKCITVLGSEEDGNLRILGSRRFATDTVRDPYEILYKMASLGDELLTEARIERPDAVGIACGSPLDNVKGIIQSPANLPGWDDIPAVRIMSEHFHCPAFLENDANCGALAEWRFGAAKGTRNAVFATFGTGFGCGLILNGMLYAGVSDMAGELGHVRLTDIGPVGCGKTGSVEGFCSGRGIAQIAQMFYREAIMQGKKPALCSTFEDLPNLTAKNVAEAAYAGDELACEVYRFVGKWVGRTMAMVMDILNPEVIVLGSIFQRAESLLRPTMEEVIEQEAFAPNRAACRVVPAVLGDHIDEYEALALASYRMNSN